MDYLLDTHALLWFFNADKRLSKKAKIIIENSEHLKFISIASFWEIAIKLAKGSLVLNIPFSVLNEKILASGFIILPVSFEHTAGIIQLPSHHNDPFDRMIIAQALIDNMSIISKDENFEHYEVKLVWE